MGLYPVTTPKLTSSVGFFEYTDSDIARQTTEGMINSLNYHETYMH